ncbi:HigA family addiction module antitoxin [Dyadobacter sp. CY323]|nr:HigA family addiction module antitoxin [Dyadobacter sp. CY323]
MKPVHPGAILREDILKEMKVSVTQAAKALNVSRKQLSEVVNETAAVSAEMAVRLEEGFGVNAEFWLEMQKNFDIWKVKSSGRIQGVQRITPTKPLTI